MNNNTLILSNYELEKINGGGVAGAIVGAVSSKGDSEGVIGGWMTGAGIGDWLPFSLN